MHGITFTEENRMGFIKCDDRMARLYNVLAELVGVRSHCIYINRCLGLFDLMHDMCGRLVHRIVRFR